MNDFKEGAGKLTCTNTGDIIEGKWIKDRIHGAALITDKYKESNAVLFT